MLTLHLFLEIRIKLFICTLQFWIISVGKKREFIFFVLMVKEKRHPLIYVDIIETFIYYIHGQANIHVTSSQAIATSIFIIIKLVQDFGGLEKKVGKTIIVTSYLNIMKL